MHAGKNFGLWEALTWTRREIYKYVALAAVITVIYEVLEIRMIAIPWMPMALIGTAVAFLIGFKNNASYDRLWEGRKIYGAIVNASRTWGIMVKDFVSNHGAATKLSPAELKEIHTRLIYRHVAWLTALRYQLRTHRVWEGVNRKSNQEYKQFFPVPEEQTPLEDELTPFVSAEEKAYLLTKKNRATQVVALQSKDLRELVEQGYLEDFRHVEMENLLRELYDQQGKAERIKNFPYPRQFATLNLYFVNLFIMLLPLGMLKQFADFGEHFVWLTIPFSTLVSWVFHTMEKIGEVSESPFQGGANDVPITNLSRTIEIDLRDMLDETDLPEPTKPHRNILL